MSKRNGIGEWIRLSRDLWTNPKVLRIAHELGVQMELPLSGPDKHRTILLVHLVVGALSRLWLVVNRHASEASDGTADAILSDIVTDDYLDEAAALPGMQRALVAVGWAKYDDVTKSIRLRNYLEFNDLHKGEKRRGARGDSESPEAKRKREERARKRAGQMPDNPPLSAPDNAGQIPDKSTEKSSEETEVLKNVTKKAADEPDGQAGVTAELERVKRIVDSLRPGSWGKVRHWSPTDEEALHRAAEAVRQITERDRALLRWWFAWCEKPGNRERWPQETNVTSKRCSFLDDLASFMQRATTTWAGAGRPALGVVVPAKAAEPPATTEPEMPIRTFREALAGVEGKPARISDGENVDNVPDQATAKGKL